jgi:hypothetical protein
MKDSPLPIVVMLIFLLLLITLTGTIEQLRWERDRAVKELALVKKIAKVRGANSWDRLCGKGWES